MIDSGTRLDNTFAGFSKIIFYNYTLINYNKDEVDVNYFQSAMETTILNVIRTNPQMKYLRENGVTFIYNYKDKLGINITSLKFTPEDYKE